MPCKAASNIAACRPIRSPGKRKIGGLAPPVRQQLKAERPTGIQRVEVRAVVAGADDLGARRRDQMIAFDLVQRNELFRCHGLEQTAGAQYTFVAGKVHVTPLNQWFRPKKGNCENSWNWNRRNEAKFRDRVPQCKFPGCVF